MSKADSTTELLLELGCEEVPARQLELASAWLAEQVPALLREAALSFDDVVVYVSPRRLAILVSGLASKQDDRNELLVGPPIGAAFDAQGQPTRAASAFAEKQHISLDQCRREPVEGKKGLYLVAQRKVAGEPAAAVLPALLTRLIGGLPWSKSMRWADGDARFVRPLHWMIALLGSDVLPVAWGGVVAGRQTRGHRFLAPGWVSIETPATYVESLRKHFVLIDPAERREMIVAEMNAVASGAGLQVAPDDGLLDEVVHLVEYPHAILGTFSAEYLEVPRPVIVTAMRTHQRYFALLQSDGSLAPSFITIAGTITSSEDAVRKGNERVLAARLADAAFFFRADRATALDAWNQKLKDVVFQAKLGDRAKTYAQKVARLETMAARLSSAVAADSEQTTVAARYCKADLMSGVVGEFPELQGSMGYFYATPHLGEEVATIIEQHYWPKGAGQALPKTSEAAVVAVADRMDTLVGCFACGMEPTGSADPLALRRAALAVLAILLDRGESSPQWRVTLQELTAMAAAAYGDTLRIDPKSLESLQQFFKVRLRGMLMEHVATQDVDAALAVRCDDVVDAAARARSVGAVPAATRELFKRIANILEDAERKGVQPASQVETALFAAADNAEWRLWNALAAQKDTIEQAAVNGDYPALLRCMADLAGPVAAFFDRGGVMVMDPDPAVAANRLALLETVIAPLRRVCDFRTVSMGGV